MIQKPKCDGRCAYAPPGAPDGVCFAVVGQEACTPPARELRTMVERQPNKEAEKK